MLHSRFTIVFGLLLAGVVQSSVQAGVVLDLIPETSTVILTGGTQTFSLTARIAADVGVQTMRAYNLPIDLAEPVGTDPPVGWSIVNVTRLFDIPPPGGAPPPNLNPAEGDLLVSDTTDLFSPETVQLTTTPLELFEFTVQLTDQAVPGVYRAFYVDGVLISVIDGNNAPVLDMTLQSATITLAVPEPGAGVALGFLFPAMLVWRRRRVGAGAR